MKQLLAFLALAFLAVSCGTVESDKFIISGLSLTAEGPLFEGSNTATGDYTVDMADFLSRNNISPDKVKSARLTSASLAMTDTINFDIIGEMTLLLAGDAADMQKVGVLNPVPSGQNEVSLQVAEEQKKIDVFFKESMFTFVLDFNVVQDTFIDLNLKGNFEFEISFKK